MKDKFKKLGQAILMTLACFSIFGAILVGVYFLAVFLWGLFGPAGLLILCGILLFAAFVQGFYESL